MNRQHKVAVTIKPYILPEISRLITSYIGDDRTEFISYSYEWFNGVKNQYIFNGIRTKLTIVGRYVVITKSTASPGYIGIKKIIKLKIDSKFGITMCRCATSLYSYKLKPINNLSQEEIALQIEHNYGCGKIDIEQLSKFIYDFLQIANMYSSVKK